MHMCSQVVCDTMDAMDNMATTPSTLKSDVMLSSYKATSLQPENITEGNKDINEVIKWLLVNVTFRILVFIDQILCFNLSE